MIAPAHLAMAVAVDAGTVLIVVAIVAGTAARAHSTRNQVIRLHVRMCLLNIASAFVETDGAHGAYPLSRDP
jgi:hypothetical protein